MSNRFQAHNICIGLIHIECDLGPTEELIDLMFYSRIHAAPDCIVNATCGVRTCAEHRQADDRERTDLSGFKAAYPILSGNQ